MSCQAAFGVLSSIAFRAKWQHAFVVRALFRKKTFLEIAKVAFHSFHLTIMVSKALVYFFSEGSSYVYAFPYE